MSYACLLKVCYCVLKCRNKCFHNKMRPSLSDYQFRYSMFSAKYKADIIHLRQCGDIYLHSVQYLCLLQPQ